MTPVLPRASRRVALVFAALFAAPLALASTAGATTSCSTTANPLGAATGYTEFIAGNGHRGSESEGAIAWGGNLDANGMTVGTRLNAGTNDPALVVAGTHGQYFNLQKGSAYLNPASGVNFNGGGHYLATNPIDFAAAFTDLRAKSTEWGAASASATSASFYATFAGQNLLGLTGTDHHLNVFSVTPAQIAATNGIAIDVPSGSTTLINVSGTTVSFTGQMWIKRGSGYEQASDGLAPHMDRILWNFPTATTVTLSFGSAWGGSILAPNAFLNVASVGHTIGQMIAASFSSNFETHQNLFPSNACLPGGGGPPPPSEADVQIAKTAASTTPTGGDLVTYTLVAQNNGPATAQAVVVRDALPVGVTFDSASSPCTQAAGIVTCDLGDLAPGASKTLTIKVIANPIAAVGTLPHPGSRHNLTVSKVEQQVDLDPGETKTVSIGCPGSGAILSDGSVRVDAVDQGTGAATDVRVLSAQSTGVASWAAVVRNDATGRAQAKAFGVCLPSATESAEGHQHSLKPAVALTTTTQAWGVGRQSATVTCATGKMPIAPGYAFAGGAATVAASEKAGAGWKFTVDVTAPTAATLSVRCLDQNLDTADGHTHALATQHLVRTVTVPAGATVEEQVTCAEDAKGIVGTWSLPAGVFSLGNDPRPKTRAFKLVNTTAVGQTATVDLECLSDRTGVEALAGVSPVTIANTATVTTTTTDTVSANNSSSASISVSPGGSAAVLSSSASASGSFMSLRAVSARSARATVSVTSGRTLLATGTVKLLGGKAKTLKLKLTGAGRTALRGRSAKRAKATLKLAGRNSSRARTITRTITVLHG